MNVNFVDLKAQHKNLNLTELNNIIKSGQFVGGQILETFENKLAKYCGTKYAIGVGSGTDAIWLSLLVLGIGPGDEVIVPANTFIATAFAVTHTGATVVFADVHRKTYNIDIASAARKVTNKTRAIIPVHLYGQACDMEVIISFAKQNKLYVIEDCAQSIGASFKGKKVGSFGDTGCISFYPTKNLGGLGQGGAILTNDLSTAEKVRSLSNVGRKRGSWYEYDKIGFNSRLDTINAWFLTRGIKNLDRNNKGRQRVAAIYENELANVFSVQTPKILPNTEHVFHLYEILLLDKKIRDDLQIFLKSNNIFTGLHYSIPCHKQSIYRKKYNNDDLFVTETLSDTLLSLPMHPNLTKVEIQYVCECIKEFFMKNNYNE